MHWVLDVTMDEDACQIYKDHGAENLSCLRHMKLEHTPKRPAMLEPVLGASCTQVIKN